VLPTLRRHRLALWVGFITAALPLAATLCVTTAAATATPKVVVKPATGLTKGKIVKVTGSGFKPDDQVFLVQCLKNATGQNQCDISTATSATIAGTGVRPSTTFKVVTGKVGNGTCGTKISNLKNCVINVGNVSGSDAASTPIDFKAPKHGPKRAS
jgi:hypothetical protein